MQTEPDDEEECILATPLHTQMECVASLPPAFELLIAPIIADLHCQRRCNIDRDGLIYIGPASVFKVCTSLPWSCATICIHL